MRKNKPEKTYELTLRDICLIIKDLYRRTNSKGVNQMRKNKPEKTYELTLRDICLIIEYSYKCAEKGYNKEKTVQDFKAFWLEGKTLFDKRYPA